MFAARDISASVNQDGSITLRSRAELSDPTTTVLHWLHDWAIDTPDAPLLTEPTSDGRRSITYREAWTLVGTLAEDLLDRGVEPRDRVVVLMSNGIDHLLVAFATMLLRAVYTPVAPQYLADTAPGSKIDTVLQHLRPRLVISESAPSSLARSSQVVRPSDIFRSIETRPHRSRTQAERFSRLQATDVAKILLTSGTTGLPKPVAMTHLMMTSNMAMTFDVWPFLKASKPEIVDWLPWNHAFGGSANVHLVLSRGGVMHVDRPAGGTDGLSRTINLLTQVRPTYHGTVPAGFAALLPVLERDLAFRHAFYARMDIMFSAGAAMNPDLYTRLRELSSTVRDRPVPIVTGWGATELGPGATMVHEPDAGPGNIGTPMPGVEVRLVPYEDPTQHKYEMWVRSPSSSRGYWHMPGASGAFSSDGYYRTGDAAAFANPHQPSAGLVFRGRVTEDFKLANGTWVDVEGIRDQLLSAASGALRDVCIVGADREFLAIIAWVNNPETFGPEDLDRLIDAHNAENPQASRRIRRGIIADPAPSGNEISQKGQMVRAAILEARTTEIERLFGLEESC
jgi:feruloyl-CoA synthase